MDQHFANNSGNGGSNRNSVGNSGNSNSGARSSGGNNNNSNSSNNSASEQAAAAADLDTSQEEIRGLSCQICYQNFTREGENVPRNLQCGHTYCTSCLSRIVGQHCIGTVRCPTCKCETLINGFMDDVKQLPKNFGVLEILAANDDAAPGGSSQSGGGRKRNHPVMPNRPPPNPPNSSSSVGPTTNSSAGYANNNPNQGSSHTMNSSFGSNENLSPQPTCSTHQGEPMKVYCKSCSELICIYCQVYGAHMNHSCELLSETAECSRREVISMSENLGRSKENLLLARQIIIETISAIRHKEEKIIREVTHHFDTLRKKVHKRECQLKDMVKCKTSQKIIALESQERTISDLIDRCELTHRICTRSLTEDDVTVVSEKDVLLNEMAILSDISSDCELAPVCVDNILCQLSRDAFDIVMIHGTIEEANVSADPSHSNSSNISYQSPQFAAASSMPPSNSRWNDTAAAGGFGDRNLVASHHRQNDGGNFQPFTLGEAASTSEESHSQSMPSNRGARCDRRNVPLENVYFPLFNQEEASLEQNGLIGGPNSENRGRFEGSFSSAEMDEIRSSLEEAIRAVHDQQLQQQQMVEVSPSSGATSNSSAVANANSRSAAQSAREAAAQAAIKRYKVTQRVVQDYINQIQPTLQQNNQNESGSNNSATAAAESNEQSAAMSNNISTIQSAMQQIQNAVTNARVSLEDSMNNNTDMRNGASGVADRASRDRDASSGDSPSAVVVGVSTEVADEDGGIYEEVSDAVTNSQPGLMRAGNSVDSLLQPQPPGEQLQRDSFGSAENGTKKKKKSSSRSRGVSSSSPHDNSSRSAVLLMKAHSHNAPSNCVNVSNGNCVSYDNEEDSTAVFGCQYCKRKYCEMCAVHRTENEKCAKNTTNYSSAHYIVELPQQQQPPSNRHQAQGAKSSTNGGNEDATVPSLNVAKNPQIVNHKFMIRCTNCGDIKEFKVNSKTCSACEADLRIDLNLYNPCPNCDLLNSKDAIACERCASDIIPIQ